MESNKKEDTYALQEIPYNAYKAYTSLCATLDLQKDGVYYDNIEIHKYVVEGCADTRYAVDQKDYQRFLIALKSIKEFIKETTLEADRRNIDLDETIENLDIYIDRLKHSKTDNTDLVIEGRSMNWEKPSSLKRQKILMFPKKKT